MRLAHRTDADGTLRPVIEAGRPGRPGDDRCREAIAVRELARHPACTDAIAADADVWVDPELEGWVDPEYHQHLAEDWELEPRRVHAPLALIVDEDPDARQIIRRILEADGYAVVTCPGPGATRCGASRLGAAATDRCPRMRNGTELVVLDAAVEETRLAEAYAAWAPQAEVRHAP